MANVAFRSGLSANLSTAPRVEGTFYLTTDTHKLYVYKESLMIDLTHFINYVATQSALPSNADVGDIYYITGENILCIKNATGWTQVNPNTQLVADDGAISLSNTTGGITITTSVEDTASHVASGSFSIVAGNDNVHLSQSGGVITISTDNNADDHLYAFGTSANSNSGLIKVTTTLGNTTTTATPITIAGSGIASVSSDNSGTITVDVPEQEIVTYANFNGSGVLTISADLASDGASSAVTPTIAYGSAGTTTAVFASGIATLDVYTKSEVQGLLSSAIAVSDAMSYKGTVSSATISGLFQAGSANNTYAGNVGDTYKASETFTYNNVTYRAGDLIIAKGTDGAVTYDVVPSGDDYQLIGEVANNSFSLTDVLSQDTFLGVTLASDNAADRAHITITGNVTSSTPNVGGEVTYTFAHGDAGTGTAVSIAGVTAATTQVNGTSSAASTLDIPVITGISKDAAGHITSVQTATYRVTDSHNYITDVSISPTVSSAEARYVITVGDNDQASANDVLVLTTSSGSGIQFSSATTTVNSQTRIATQIDFVWGTF